MSVKVASGKREINYTKALHIYLEECNRHLNCEGCPLSGGKVDDDDLCFRLTSLGREFEKKELLVPQASYGRVNR